MEGEMRRETDPTPDLDRGGRRYGEYGFIVGSDRGGVA
jgi:hypothetical protein